MGSVTDMRQKDIELGSGSGNKYTYGYTGVNRLPVFRESLPKPVQREREGAIRSSKHINLMVISNARQDRFREGFPEYSIH